MICTVCQRDTASLVIDGQNCCSVCRTPYVGNPKRSMDLTRRTQPVSSQSVVPSSRPAASVHSRVAKSSHVIDLSAATITPPPHAAVDHPVARTQAPPPHSTVHERHLARFTDRFEQARHYSRSEKISRFGTDRFGNVNDPDKMHDKFGNPTLEALERGSAEVPAVHVAETAHPHSSYIPTEAPHELPHLAATQHEAMTRLTPAVPAATPAPRPFITSRPSIGPGASRALAMTAAVLIMGGYIWLQNYPKLAIQAADSRSGIQASLPAFVPSSYALASTNVGPGQVTLNFTSASVPGTLTINQKRTSWDPTSLLYNYISKTTDDYAAIQGQGLTIYMFGQNQATWVNRGIWFSIAGASRLSRDDILKIAYSM